MQTLCKHYANIMQTLCKLFAQMLHKIYTNFVYTLLLGFESLTQVPQKYGKSLYVGAHYVEAPKYCFLTIFLFIFENNKTLHFKILFYYLKKYLINNLFYFKNKLKNFS